MEDSLMGQDSGLGVNRLPYTYILQLWWCHSPGPAAGLPRPKPEGTAWKLKEPV